DNDQRQAYRPAGREEKVHVDSTGTMAARTQLPRSLDDAQIALVPEMYLDVLASRLGMHDASDEALSLENTRVSNIRIIAPYRR
ncbi:alpha/beta hydrolase, partial [Escherichia coli]|nr:alpha/beta hydrolase [Escherichia coli]